VLIPAAAWFVRRTESQAGSETDAQRDPADCELAARDPAECREDHRDPRLSGAPLRPPKSTAVPLFVVAFILFVIVRTVGDTAFHADATMWHAVVNAGQSASELFLVCGMTTVGLSVSFTDMWRIGWRPLAAGFLVATLVGVCSLTLTLATHRFLG